MATLYVTEYSLSGFGTMTVVAAPPLGSITADWSIPIGVGSSQGLTFQDSTQIIQVSTDTACSIAYGTNPVAVTTAHRMAANETRFYIVSAGNKLAVIENI